MSEAVDRERPLFNGALYVQVKYPDHEKTLALTARVLRGSRPTQAGLGGGQREEVLHVELTDELDAFFLYTLQVGEDDYHQLKHDQRLRVDFKAFPQQFIDLLESCVAAPVADAAGTSAAAEATTTAATVQLDSAHERQCSCQGGGCGREAFSSSAAGGSGGARGWQVVDDRYNGPRYKTAAGAGPAPASHPVSAGAPAFLARLETQPACGGGPLFSIVETNLFKELTHLSLRFRAGGDAAIKQYLAARLRQLKGEAAHLSRNLAVTERSLADEQCKAAALAEEAIRLRADREREVRDVRVTLSAEAAAASAAAAERAEAAAAAHASAQRRMEEAARAERDALNAKLAECEARRAEEASARASLDGEVRALRQRAMAAEEAAAAATEEMRQLRDTNRRHESEAFRLEKEVQALGLRVAALTQQVADKEETANKSAALLSASEGARIHTEESLAAYKANATTLQERLEASITEIDRGNAIIARIQAEHRALRNKAKLKSEVVRQQERVIQEHREAAASYEARLRTSEAEGKAAANRAAAAEAKLAESTRLLASNQQVIAWLNKELNDAHLGGGGGGNGGIGMSSGFGGEGKYRAGRGAGLDDGMRFGAVSGAPAKSVGSGDAARAGTVRFAAPAYEGDANSGAPDAGFVYRGYQPPNIVSPERGDMVPASPGIASTSSDRNGGDAVVERAVDDVGSGGRQGEGNGDGGRILDALSWDFKGAQAPGMMADSPTAGSRQRGGVYDDYDYGLDEYGITKVSPAAAYGVTAF